MAAVCDLWCNEGVGYNTMFGGTTPAVFVEILGYDAALMNTSIALGYQKELQACLVNSDRYRDPQSFILCPDNAWAIGKAVVDNHESLYARARAAAIRCGELILGDPQLRLTVFERESLKGYMEEMEALPDKEADFIDLCLKKYSKVKGFRPASYGL
jgi:methanol--5-hydroxybenzimidazolylcobamide Co-methyltransferase